jgi:hypothetical protein
MREDSIGARATSFGTERPDQPLARGDLTREGKSPMLAQCQLDLREHRVAEEESRPPPTP